MSKNTYWIADVDGVKALVDGADERDFWVRVHGWSETTEPEGLEFVWLQNEEHGGKGKFNAQAVPLWTDRGWQPCAPPEPVNLAIPPERAAAPEPAKPAETPKSTSKSATSGDKKE
jgi:hypothetical protein